MPYIVREVGGESLVGFVPNSLILWIVVSVVLILVLRRSGYGRMLYAYGNNPPAMRLAGMRSWQLLLAHVRRSSACCAAIAGILLAGLINAADLGLADSLLLPSVAAAVIGGTSIFGGIGTYSGTIMGALILTVLDSLLTLLNADDVGPPDPLRPDHPALVTLLRPGPAASLTLVRSGLDVRPRAGAADPRAAAVARSS